jgi:hypothetical protein
MYTDATHRQDAASPYHHGFFYQTEADYSAVVLSFLGEGLRQNERVLYIVERGATEATLAFLEGMDGDITSFIRRRQLIIQDSADVYRHRDYFDPEAVIARLRTEAERTAAEGYAGLRITGDMRWVLKGLLDVRRLVEYEAKLNEFLVQTSSVSDTPCLALCQYDRRRFTSDVLLDVLRAHPTLIVDQDIYDNSYYMPPDELLAPYSEAAQLEHCLENLAERKRLMALLERRSEAQVAIVEHRLPDLLGHASERFHVVSSEHSV